MKPTAKGFFCGAGLKLLGLQQAGVEIVESNEINPSACATLRRNFHHKVNEGDFRQRLALDGGPSADVYVFTYPCNKYAGIAAIHGQLTGDELYLHALRMLALDPPEAYVLENVPGMRAFPVVMEAMTRLPGYHVHVICPVSAQLWLPQRRDRLIIFGTRRPFAWRAPSARRATPLREILERRPEVTLPPYAVKRLRGGYRDLPIICDAAAGDIAPTCVAHYGRDRSTRLVRDRRFKHGVRPFTVREYARLQGVPDSFEFCGTEREQYEQIGNGVAVPVARWIGRELMRYFNHRRAA